MHETRIVAENLYPQGITKRPLDEEELKEFNIEKYNDFVKKFNEYSITIDKYAPFYQAEFYKKFIEIRGICHQFGVVFEIYEIDNNFREPMPRETSKQVYHTYHEELENLVDSLQEELREYFRTLRLEE